MRSPARPVLGAVLVACIAACSRARPVPSPPVDPLVPTGFDHVIVAIDTIDRGIALLRAATGVAPRLVELEPADSTSAVATDRGLGTQSALLRGTSALRSALLDLGGGRYLELIGVDPQHPDAGRWQGTYAPFRTLTPLAWGVRTSDALTLRAELVAHHARPGELRVGERQLSGRGLLRWRTLTPWEIVSTLYPAFIEWDRASGHPSAGAPAGCTLIAFTLGAPDADTIRVRLRRAGVGATVVPTARQTMTVTLDCPTGRVELPARAP